MHATDTEAAKDRWSALFLVALIAFAVGLQFYWLQKDETPFPYGDSYAYLSRLLRTLDQAQISTPSDLWQFVRDLSHSGRPPAYQLATIPFIWICGRSEDAVVSVNLLFTAIMMASVFWSASIITNRKAGLLAALIIASYPPLVGLQRMYWMHAAVPACSALSLALLLYLLQKRSAVSGWLFGSSLGFGLLMHPSFAWFWAVPSIVFGTFALLFQHEPRLPDSLFATPRWVVEKLRSPIFGKVLLPGALVALSVGSAWYLTQGMILLDERRRMISESFAGFRGYETMTIGFREIPNTPLWFAVTAPAVVSNVLAVLALFGLIYTLARPSLKAMVPAVGLMSGYAFYGVFFPVKDWYHFAPILPFPAVLTACALARLPHVTLRRTLVVLAGGAAAFSLYVTSTAVPKVLLPVASWLGAPLDSNVCTWPRAVALCPHPPRPAESLRRPGSFPTPKHERQLLQRILESSECNRGKACRLLFVRGTAGMLPTRLLYLLARDWPDSNLRVVDDSSHIWGYPYPLNDLLNADFLIYSDYNSPDLYQAASLSLLNSPPPLFSRSHERLDSIELVGGYSATVLRRTKPLTLAEAEETIDALELQDQYKFQKFSIIASLLESSGRYHEALGYLEEGLDRPELTQAMRDHLRKMRSRIQRSIDRKLS